MYSRISPQLDKRLAGSGPRPYRRQSQQHPLTALSSRFKFYFVAGVFTALLIPFLITLCVFAYFWAFDRIAPQVRVGNTSLEGMSVYDAAVNIQKNYNLDRQIILSDGARSWKLFPSSLGLNVNPLATAQTAFQVGHGHDFVTDILQIMASQKNGSIIQPVVQFDAKAARLGLEALSKQVEIPPVNASLRLDGDKLIATPGVQGYSLDIEKTLDTLSRNSAGIVASGSLSLPLQAVAPRIADVSASQSKIQRLLDSSFRIVGYDPVSNESLDWTVSREDRLKWLKLNQDGTERNVEIGVDAAQVQAYLDSLNHSLAPDRRIELSEYLEPAIQSIQDGQELTILIRHNPTTYIVKSSDTLFNIGWKNGIPYWRMLAANPGVQDKRLGPGEEVIIPSKDDLLPLPVILGKRIVVSISQQHLWAYQDGETVLDEVISTGIDSSPTQPGVYQVQSHEINAYAELWNLHMPHFLGIYEAWPGFMNGFHGLPTLSNGNILWAEILGRPASYGCIILTLDAAEKLYDWAENGVVVEIQP